MTKRKEKAGQETTSGMYVNKSSVPKTGTVLTPKRIEKLFRSVNSSRHSSTDETPEA